VPRDASDDGQLHSVGLLERLRSECKDLCPGARCAATPASDMTESIDHPPHYGSKDDPYEAIKVVEAWGLDFHLGNVVKYISRAGKKGDILEDLKKARWYLERKIENLEKAKAK
jgi:Protein of unknwon function (DUF3310)